MFALIKSARDAGHKVQSFRKYQPCETLILYGWGGAEQQRAVERHVGNYVCFDLGYWDRDGLERRNWRVSINGFHCPELMMRGESPPKKRPTDNRIKAQDLGYNKKGRILLIGNGPKSTKVISGGWAAEKCQEVRNAFPDRRIHYRTKPRRPEERGVRHDGLANGELFEELRKSSLVVCRHSNVAIDACRVGVPVLCEDGAGAAIYPSDIADYMNQPTMAQRQDLLARLAWWQWSIREIKEGQFWPWIEKQLSGVDKQ